MRQPAIIIMVTKGAVKYCSYGECPSVSRKMNTELFHFISFPQPCHGFRQNFITTKELHISQCCRCSKCELWVRRCGLRDDRLLSIDDVAEDTYICSLHFVGGKGPTYDHPDPIDYRKNILNQVQVKSETKQFTQGKYNSQPEGKDCEEDVQNFYIEITQERTPPEHAHGNNLSTSTMLDKIKAENSSQLGQPMDCDENPTVSFVVSYPESSPLNTNTSKYENYQLRESIIVKNPQYRGDVLNKENSLTDQSVQTEYRNITKKNKRVQVKLRRLCLLNIFENSIKANEDQCKFYTSLNYEQITILQNLVDPIKDFVEVDPTNNKMQKFISIQQLILTLMRLRINPMVEDMSYRFQISASLLSEIVATWIDALYDKFKLLKPLQFLFPSVVIFNETPETDEKFESLKNIRVIIDCTEFQYQAPKDEEKLSCCIFKPKSVYRALIGCTSRGGVCFVSDIYEGNITCSEIFIQSRLADHLEPGDIVIADKKFAIREIVESKQAYLNVPPYLKGKEQLTIDEQMELQQINMQHLYIEHVIARIKSFAFLQKAFSPHLLPLMSKVLYVCACLVNFQPPIVIK